MAIELHLCAGGDFRTTTDFLECGNCSAIIPNKTRADGVVTCGSCGSEWEPDEVPDARVEEIVQAVVDAANLKDERDRLQEQVRILREALADLCDSQLTSREREEKIARGIATLEATKEGA